MVNRNGKSVSFLVRLGLVFFVALSIFIAWSIVKQTVRKRDNQKEITKLEKEATKVTQENNLLKERISYFESSEYKEREAKEKLNLKKADENVVIVKPGIIKKEIDEEEEDIPLEKDLVYKNNFKKWWEYFSQH